MQNGVIIRYFFHTFSVVAGYYAFLAFDLCFRLVLFFQAVSQSALELLPSYLHLPCLGCTTRPRFFFPTSVLRIESRVSNILDKFFTREQHPQPPTMWKLVGRSCRILSKKLWVLIRTLHPTPLFKWEIKTDFFTFICKQGRNFMHLLSPTQIDFIEKWNDLLGAFN